MNGIRTEQFHYTRDQVTDHLRDALEVLVAAEVPAELAPVALPLVFQALSAKEITIERVGAALGVPMIPRG